MKKVYWEKVYNPSIIDPIPTGRFPGAKKFLLPPLKDAFAPTGEQSFTRSEA